MEKYLQGVNYEILQSVDNGKITGIEYDSKKIKNGNIFVALEGAIVDGHNYIQDAIENGAKTIFISKKVELLEGITYVFIKELRKNLGIIATNFFNAPQEKLKIIGVTGTNGKTTTTYLLEAILGADKIARIGTVEYKIGDEVIEAPNTTPESLDIVKICKKAVEKNLEYLVMEVSSHALSMGRVDMLKFDAVSFTNLTVEHLDYHKDMENYFLAKRKLFTMLKKGCESNLSINIDDEFGERLYKEFGGISYSLGKKADLEGKILEFHTDGQLVEIKDNNGIKQVKVPLLGRFNLYNILGVIGIAKKLLISDERIYSALMKTKGAIGRFELVNCGQDYTVVVDYAHTGDALENILSSINELKKRRIITIFGCGGDRDATKRPIMGAIAQKNSDVVILTSDNPRTENPQKIIDDVLSGMDIEKCIVEVDREKAIMKGIEIVEKDDIVLIAGKGHETYQIIGHNKVHFDDKEIVRREIVRKRNWKGVKC